MTKESQAKASAKYDAANTKQVKMKLNKNTDADIINKLDNVSNVQGYIKSLIRTDAKDDLSKRVASYIRNGYRIISDKTFDWGCRTIKMEKYVHDIVSENGVSVVSDSTYTIGVEIDSYDDGLIEVNRY